MSPLRSIRYRIVLTEKYLEKYSWALPPDLVMILDPWRSLAEKWRQQTLKLPGGISDTFKDWNHFWSNSLFCSGNLKKPFSPVAWQVDKKQVFLPILVLIFVSFSLLQENCVCFWSAVSAQSSQIGGKQLRLCLCCPSRQNAARPLLTPLSLPTV